MVTANFLNLFSRTSLQFDLIGITFSTYHTTMIVMIGAAVILAISGGQNTIMVTSFFQGIITSLACIGCMWFSSTFGWDTLIGTLLESEHIRALADTGPHWFTSIQTASKEGVYPKIIASLTRPEGVSMMNPLTRRCPTSVPPFHYDDYLIHC